MANQITAPSRQRQTSASSARSEGSASERNRTFNNESGLFGEAHVASSIVSRDLSMIEEEFDDRRYEQGPVFSGQQPRVEDLVEAAQREALAEIARNTRTERIATEGRTVKQTIKDFKDDVFARLSW